LRDRQIVGLNPGRTCRAIEFAKMLRDRSCQADVTIAEAETFIYGSVSQVPANARTFSMKDAMLLAGLPPTQTAMKWLRMAHNGTGGNRNGAIHNQTGHGGTKAVPTLRHRCRFGDARMSLVPMLVLEQRHGASVRGMDSIIRLACIMHRADYRRRRRAPNKFGVEQLSMSQLTRCANEGVRDW